MDEFNLSISKNQMKQNQQELRSEENMHMNNNNNG